MPYAHFTYTVIGHRVVAPTDVAAATAERRLQPLVLSACTPLFSAAKRLLVFARLTRAVPLGAGTPADRRPASRSRSSTRCTRRRGAQLPPVLESLGPHYVAPAV